ncbi:DUF6286 domain-containing protein [Nocardia sp. BMG51109]|uniref:DUF6286 domain-containing protein n=1 Tax=Nocardia sp. BMG51109 TaxID=1056816 RepID=UPI000463B6FE|nr:DUF6286 domain-containing protein [Nocardia sp. BMG51109]
MRRRPSRAAPAGLVALAVLAVCVVVVLSLVQRLTGAKELVSYDAVANRLSEMDWGDARVTGFGVAAILAGLVLLGLAVLPGRPVVVPLAATDEISAGVVRRTLRDALRAAATSVPGVHSARIRLRRKTVRLTIRADRTHSAELTETVRAAADNRLARIGPHPSPRVSTRLRHTGSVR